MQPTDAFQLISVENALARVSVQDGDAPKSIVSAANLADYLRIFTEAENDQGCRVFQYGPDCSTSLLMPLFEHFDFSRFSLFPYGFANNFSVTDHWGAGSCTCKPCMDGQLCGHYALQKNMHFYGFIDVSSPSSTSPKIASDGMSMTIVTGDR